MKEIQGKRIVGYSFADGVHWYWGDTEVAVINEEKREIEWCDRTFRFPKEVVDEIRGKIPENPGVWIIEARRVNRCATGGNVNIYINGKDMGMHFEDKYVLKDGDYISETPDDELGKFVYACFWHKLDYAYKYSHRFRKIFNKKWEDEDNEQ